MDQQLHSAGYQLDSHTGVFQNPDFAGIRYSDGDETELRIEAIIQSASDLSTFSPQLKLHCTDWASTYHLSSLRSNILRPFEFSAGQDILEIGAGCGAITRYLGEAGANVLALEGSSRRSKMARSRTRDLSNVTVVCETFSEFEIEQKFDVITLIGVLEYASLYVYTKNPEEDMLKSVATLLKPNGFLILAIENQFGLKYFAGAPEDHLQIPMYGIEGRYEDAQPKTFGQSSLASMLSRSGLTEQSYWAPFPDYKLPISIVSEQGFKQDEFDPSVFAWQSARQDPQLVGSSELVFSIELAWVSVFQEKLGLRLANSFLIQASFNHNSTPDTSILAYHYSTNRVRKFCKETIFKLDNLGQVMVQPSLLSPEHLEESLEEVIRFESPSITPYAFGKPLSLEFVQLVATDDWKVDDIGLFFRRYISFLEVFLQQQGSWTPNSLLQGKDKVPGAYFDAIPQNIIIKPDGSPTLIDVEWKLPDEIDIGMCVFRSILLMLSNVSRIGHQPEGRHYSRLDFVKEVFKSVGFSDLDEIDINRYVEIEAIVQEQITGRSRETFLQWFPGGILGSETIVERLHNASKVKEELEELADQRFREIKAIENSRSWRMTAPLRNLKAQIKASERPYFNLVKTHHKIIEISRIFYFVKSALTDVGGVTKLPSKIFEINSREGFGGIKYRLANVVKDSFLGRFDDRGRFHRNDYTEWVRRYSTLTDDARSVIRQRASALGSRPLISIILPVFNPPADWLIQCVDSVRNQLYLNWELCIADDRSTDLKVHNILKRYANLDNRIKIVFREENGHISAASNSALDLAVGNWIVLLDHDDKLSEDALYRVVEAINNYPTVRLIYSDEDKINEANQRLQPYFKPDWNLDLFYSQNMFSHLGAYRLDLVKEVGGFRVGYEGSQDYDLALRCIEKVDANQIHHIPYVLYHWRIHEQSTAHSHETKPYAQVSALRALSEHFQRIKIDAKAMIDGSGYRVRFAVPEKRPLVTLVIPIRNSVELLERCIGSIFEKTLYDPYEIVIIDNGSDETALLEYLQILASKENVTVVRDESRFNFSALVNQGVKLANGEIVGLLNNDTEVISPDWMTEMVSQAMRPDVGAVGARLWYPNDHLQHGGLIIGVGGVAGHAHKHLPSGHAGYFGRANLISNFSAVTAACLFIRKNLYTELGGLNEDRLGVAFNDVDFGCRLVTLGYRNVWTPYANLYHHESASRGSDRTKTGPKYRFELEMNYVREKWQEILSSDPAYSPNLTLVHEDLSYAWPPRVEILGLTE